MFLLNLFKMSSIKAKFLIQYIKFQISKLIFKFYWKLCGSELWCVCVRCYVPNIDKGWYICALDPTLLKQHGNST